METPFPFNPIGPWDFVIIGAGSAGVAAARTLRRENSQASILLLDQEDRPPYKKTKTSKNIIKEYPKDAWLLEDLDWYTQNGIALAWKARIVEIKPNRCRLYLKNGEEIFYERLLLCLGASANTLADYPEALALRSAEDGEAIQNAVKDQNEIHIVGNGVLGIELADQMIQLGKTVTVHGRNPLPLSQCLTPKAAEHLKHLLDHNKVLQTDSPADPQDFCLLAVGSKPNTRLADQSGLRIDKGILVSPSFQTSNRRIWAAGDCIQLPGGRIPHLWHHAEATGELAALAMSDKAILRKMKDFRMKVEVFGEYFFTVGPREGEPSVERSEGGVYQAFWFKEGKLRAAVMYGDKERSRMYQQAIWEKWSEDKTLSELSL
jgi:NAD(P)H-nitrite reductase large subunit